VGACCSAVRTRAVAAHRPAYRPWGRNVASACAKWCRPRRLNP
jgi:hypothetical protein